MRGLWKRIALGLVLAPSVLMLASCGVVHHFRGPANGASTDKAAYQVSKTDPLAEPIQVAWTSARASYCGFVFQPNQLKAKFMAAQQAKGLTPDQMQKVVHAYNYTLISVTKTIKTDPNYCDRNRTDAIRTALKHYLAGDYSYRASVAQ